MNIDILIIVGIVTPWLLLQLVKFTACHLSRKRAINKLRTMDTSNLIVSRQFGGDIEGLILLLGSYSFFSMDSFYVFYNKTNPNQIKDISVVKWGDYHRLVATDYSSPSPLDPFWRIS